MHHIEEIYGFRGADARVYYLNPWEFLMFWEVERVGTPKQYAQDEMPVSVWTGVEVLPGTQAEAGKHYVIDDVGLRDHPDYIALPDIPAMQQMRHEWVLRRANRPYVPHPDSTPMPDHAGTPEDKAKLYSVYLRPWVLDKELASTAVPHITELNSCDGSSSSARTDGGENTDVTPRRRITGKTPGGIVRSFARAWQHYIRHRIVSVHAKRIKAQFMAACCGKSTTEDAVENQPGVMPTEMEKNETCSVSLQYVHNIIRETASPKSQQANDEREDPSIESRKVSDQMRCSLRLGSALWSFENVGWSADDVSTHGNVPLQTKAKTKTMQQKANNEDVRFQETVYVRITQKAVARWFHKIQNETVKPNQNQLAYLRDIANRCMQEAQELKDVASLSKKPAPA